MLPSSDSPYTVPLRSTAGALMHHSKPLGCSPVSTQVMLPSGWRSHVSVDVLANCHSTFRPASRRVTRNGPLVEKWLSLLRVENVPAGSSLAGVTAQP